MAAKKIRDVVAKARALTTPQTARMTFPTTERLAYGMMFKFKQLTYDIRPGSKAQFSNHIRGAHIFLPLPTGGIWENLNMNYATPELGIIGQAIGMGATSAGAVLGGLGGEGSDSAMTETVRDLANRTAGGAAYLARSLVNAVGAGSAIDMKLGTVVNPYALALFQSVAPRQHQLEWRLFPRTESDSRMIRNIVNQFKFHALPERKPDGFFLTMPSEVEMQFFGTDKLFRFAPAVIVGVMVNYTPQGAPAFFGATNAPTGVILTLNLQEIESLARDAYTSDGVSDAFGTNIESPQVGVPVP